MRRALFVAAAAALSPAVASAQVVVGYQLGLTQSLGTTLGDDLNTATLLAQQNQQANTTVNPTAPGGPARLPAANVDTAGLNVSALQGFQSNTQVSANVTLDLVTRTLQHGLVFGATFGQLIPFAVPESQLVADDDTVTDVNAQLRERISTLQATAAYVTRLQQATWSLGFQANYAFALNGRLNNGANGGVTGGAALGTLPAAEAGAFAFNGITHTAGGQLQLQITKQRWDLATGLNYTYTQNGIYTLAAGVLGGQGAPNAATTNLGAFIPANLHTLTPTLILRTRAGRRGQVTLDANSSYTQAQVIRDDIFTDAEGNVVVTPAPRAPPQTLINSLRVEYEHRLGRDRTLGADVTGVLSYREGTDAQGEPVAGATLASDTFIYTGRAFYRDTLPWELRIRLAAGVAQAFLFQAPLGAPNVDPGAFSTVGSAPEPVAELNLQRRFDPVDVTLTAARTVGVGALGASAIVTESGALTFQHVAELGERRLISNLGFNANRTVGVGQEFFEGVDPNDPLVAAFNNYGAGVTAGMAMPIFVSGPFSVDGALTYNFNWVDTDPNDVTGIPPIVTHVGLFTLRMVFGRGTAQNAAGIGGRIDSDELDAFSANPSTGAPLLTQRLLRQGAPLQQGARPGEAPATRRDSRQAYQQSIRQQEIEREARERAGALLGTGTSEEEERRALEKEKEEQKKAEEERSRDFGDWPMEAIPLPDGGGGASPQRPPP